MVVIDLLNKFYCLDLRFLLTSKLTTAEIINKEEELSICFDQIEVCFGVLSEQ